MVVIPEKTHIAFQVHMSFAAVRLRKRWVDAHVVIARRLESPRFPRIQTFPPATIYTSFGSRATTRSPSGSRRPIESVGKTILASERRRPMISPIRFGLSGRPLSNEPREVLR
jgi:hypothetical protein